jgi:crotonobetainyl-CoA:carnitine CoA-transferase CaiB-like acyl-CoA transferase
MSPVNPIPPIRILDLTDERGFLCGKILVELGADVIKIENVGGQPQRLENEKSLFWLAYNAGKRCITLNIESADGKEIFKRLAKGADIVIESFHPGYMSGLGLGYETLSKMNPRLIFVSITPFGQTGPYRDYMDSDLVLSAMGGVLYLTGDPDRRPVRTSFPQCYLNGAAEAAVATMLAYYWREDTGEGQYVDVAIQPSLLLATSNSIPRWSLNKELSQRGGTRRMGYNAFGAAPRQIWPCKDGYVAFMLMGARVGARTNSRLVEWMDTEGMANETLRKMDWINYDMRAVRPEELDQIEGWMGEFFKAHTKAELHEGAVKRDIMLCPVNTVKDIFTDPQLESRRFWKEVNYPGCDSPIRYPGPFFRSSEMNPTPIEKIPRYGEHNREVFEDELGLSREEILRLEDTEVI